MSRRRAMAASLAALAMPASLLMVSTSQASEQATEAPYQSTTRIAKQKVKLTAMPQIVQQGKKATSANKAKSAFTAQLKPRKRGVTVALQQKKGKGWKTVDKAKTNKRGVAELAGKGNKVLTYRAVFGKARSKPVSTERWVDASFTDEFSGSSLSANWNHRATTYSPESLRECSRGDASATKVGGGVAKLSVIVDPARKGEKCVAKKDGKSTGKFAYRLNGHIGTQGAVSMKYGFAAARIKMHKLRGQHGGFWMQPTDSVAGATDPKDTGAEIDVIEYFGDKHKQGGLTSFIYSTNKAGKDVKTGSWIKNPESFLKNKRDGWSKSYHVFSVEWTPRMYIFRIDGKETWRTKVGVSGQPQFPILSLLSSDYEIYQLKGGDKKLPQTMQVDWIRLWQA